MLHKEAYINEVNLYLTVDTFYIHRGQESAGIVTSDGNSVPTFKTHKVYLNIMKC